MPTETCRSDADTVTADERSNVIRTDETLSNRFLGFSDRGDTRSLLVAPAISREGYGRSDRRPKATEGWLKAMKATRLSLGT